LGRALTALHSLPPRSAATIEIGIEPQKWNCRTAFDGLGQLAGEAPATQDLAPEPYAWLQEGPAVPEEYTGPPSVLHDDLQPDHIIITPSSGRLAGIIDWGLGLGDPAQDLTFILPWRGWASCVVFARWARWGTRFWGDTPFKTAWTASKTRSPGGALPSAAAGPALRRPLQVESLLEGGQQVDRLVIIERVELQ
jgi:hypothetical protein